MTDGTPSLATREGLPEALRVLLERYPRAAWEADPGFSHLIRFWLDRHILFRQLLDRLTTDAERMLDGDTEAERYGRLLSRFGGMFVGELHTHHTVEDTRFFPVLSQKDLRLSAGFDLLDADHHALDAQLEELTARANTVLQSDPAGHATATGRLHKTLTGFAPLLNRHLLDEEDLIVPVLLAHGDAGLP
ncbi:MAG: hemerythrin domain-containing protein [Pseudomonadota bacterium]